MPQRQQQEQANRGIDALMAGSMSVLDLATHWQTEALRFMGRRMSDYARTTEQLRHCRSPGDVLSLQANFVLQMLSDYQAEADKFLKEWLSLQRPARQAMEGAFETYEDSLRQSHQIAEDTGGEDAEDDEPSGRRKKKSAQN